MRHKVCTGYVGRTWFLHLLSNTSSSVQYLMSWGRLFNSIAAEFCSVPGTVDGSRRRSQEDLKALAGLYSTILRQVGQQFWKKGLAYRPIYVIVSTITNEELSEFQNVWHIRIVIVHKTCRGKFDTLEPAWEGGRGLVLPRKNLPDPRRLYYKFLGSPLSPLPHWQSIGSRFSIVPLYTLLAMTDPRPSLRSPWKPYVPPKSSSQPHSSPHGDLKTFYFMRKELLTPLKTTRNVHSLPVSKMFLFNLSTDYGSVLNPVQIQSLFGFLILFQIFWGGWGSESSFFHREQTTKTN